ncbi:MAG: type II secretion system F family protein [Bdellovibrionaceae bacterium]|nr:type II secretion system F family protein [Pseudobdellovibrionaceae bacterium]
MAKFSYQAKNLNGQMITGDMDGLNEVEVRTKLRQMNMNVVSVVAKPGHGKSLSQMLTRGPKVKIKDLQIFTRQFATLINAGIPVVDALKVLSEGQRPGVLKDAVGRVKNSIESGKKLSDSMAQNPNVFDKLYSNMIHAGEEAGILDSILARLATYMEKNEKIKAQVKGAMVYPAVIVVVAIFVIAAILIFIIPKFQDFFRSAGKEPPALTSLVVGLSDSMIKYWYLVLLVLIGGPYFLKQWIDTPAGKIAFEAFIFRAPLFGELVRKGAIARVTRTLSTLLSSGVGLIDAIDIAAKTAGNIVVERSLQKCKDSVIQGKPFANPLAKDKVFPDMVVQMISVGEQSGTLDNMLSKIADFYDDEVETSVKALSSLVEPLLMVILGGVIAVLVVAMYLPIFSMAGNVGG